jgi:hypothetical protein
MPEHGLLAFIQVELDYVFDAIFPEYCRYSDGDMVSTIFTCEYVYGRQCPVSVMQMASTISVTDAAGASVVMS